MRGSEVVAAARRWIGTPYVHQASRIGAGCDCLGLVRGVWRALYGQECTSLPAYTPDWAEPAHNEVLQIGLGRFLVARPGGAEAIAPGDVLLLRMHRRAIAKHLGIVAQTGASPSLIHAYARHGVVENAFSAPWARRVVARFHFPDRRI